MRSSAACCLTDVLHDSHDRAARFIPRHQPIPHADQTHVRFFPGGKLVGVEPADGDSPLHPAQRGPGDVGDGRSVLRIEEAGVPPGRQVDAVASGQRARQVEATVDEHRVDGPHVLGGGCRRPE
jgi:hypothetical protein